MTHTPGPWKLTEDQEIVGANGEEIAWGFHSDFDALTDKIKLEDATLIAAAPELLEALRGVMPDLETAATARGLRADDFENIRVAHAAIAKAEGKPCH